MAVAGALVIDVGGLISRGAIVARELGIPCVIGTNNGTQILHDGDTITVGGTTRTVTEATHGSNTLPFSVIGALCRTPPPPGRPPAAERGPARRPAAAAEGRA